MMLLLSTVLLLLLSEVLLSLAWIPARVTLLLLTNLVAMLLLTSLVAELWLVSLPVVHMLHVDLATLQVDVYSTFIGLCMKLQPLLSTYLLNPRLDLLDMSWTVIAFSDDNM